MRIFIRAGLYPTSQEIHIKQGAGTYLHITSFNGRVIQFRVLRFIIFRIIGKIYQHLRDFDEISTILMQYRPQIQEYRPFGQNGRLSTNGR